MAKASEVSKDVYGAFQLRADAGWADHAMSDLAGMTEPDRALWVSVLQHWQIARPAGDSDWPSIQREVESACLFDPQPYAPDDVHHEPGSEAFVAALATVAPAGEWTEQMRALIHQVGVESFCSRCASWIESATRSSTGLLNRNGGNRELLRAMLWCVHLAPSPRQIDAVRKLCRHATEHKTAQGVTCVLVLAAVANEESLAALHQLLQGAKRSTPRGRFHRAALHVERVLGISAEVVAERFVPTYSLDSSGCRTQKLGDVTVSIRLSSEGTTLELSNADGKMLKSVPSKLRKDHSGSLKELRNVVKSIDEMIRIQRERLDDLDMFRRAPICYSDFDRHYLKHPLVSHLAERLIWSVDSVPAVLQNAVPAVDVDGKAISIRPDALIRLWHPIGQPPAEVLRWRGRLEELGITQPLRQAHREVYILTPPELHTRTYSNRFASHILRQHQMAALARARGWDYSLQGQWDGSGGPVSRKLPRERLRAEYSVTPVASDDQGVMSRFVSTDQLRFYAEGSNEPLPLHQIPPLVFSEVMRDVDLFVGVASVGNDPTWQDGGPEGRYANYWQSYSFGDLSETAKTRKAVLETLLPRLTKLKDRWRLEEKFLVIRGQIRSYKIHLGSGNILMTPNDQYLCIVADRSSKAGEQVFLPFEGDSTLSVILSKAFLLAADDKITDPTITRQLR